MFNNSILNNVLKKLFLLLFFIFKNIQIIKLQQVYCRCNKVNGGYFSREDLLILILHAGILSKSNNASNSLKHT